MKATIVTIGDELLIGQVIDTNSAWIARQLNSMGIEVFRIVSVSDKRQEIINILEEAKAGNVQFIFITGGLGPTNDDITKKTLHEYFGGAMYFHGPTLKGITRFFKDRGVEMTELNKKQAEVPDTCLVLMNPHGTAPGMWFEKDNKIYISLPGVPYEMKHIIENEVLPKIKTKFNLDAIIHKTVLTQGIGESFLSELIAKWESNLPENIKLAYLPSPGIVRLRLSVFGDNKTRMEKQLETEIEKLSSIIGKYIYGYDDDTLEEIIGRLLTGLNTTLCTAESCTGGAIASQITSVPGSSRYFKGSVVAYSNDIKAQILKVNKKDLDEFGAVSKPVVVQMAKGALELFGTGYAIATSGIAGPTGGTDEKPVGTTWIAVASKEKIIALKYAFGEHRGRNITKTSVTAFNMLRKLILKESID